MPANETDKKPVVADLEKVRRDNEVAIPELLSGDESQIDAFVSRLKEVGDDDPGQQAELAEAAKSFTVGAIEVAQQKNSMLRKPLSKYSNHENGKQVADSLVALSDKVSEVAPSNFNLSVGGIRGMLSKIPFIGDPVKNYMEKFLQAEEVIGQIATSLEDGRDSLEADNAELIENISAMRLACANLKKAERFGRTLKERIETELSSMGDEDPSRRFVQEEILFPINQGIQDTQEMLAVTQQGILAYGIITENNRQLIRGIDRARNTTVAALKIGATMAVALSNQKQQLDKLNEVNTTTSDLIAANAKQLRGQGVEIQKQASTSSLDINKLESAIADTLAAVEDVSRFRIEAIPAQSQQIERFDALIETGNQAVERARNGIEARSDLLSIEAVDGQA